MKILENNLETFPELNEELPMTTRLKDYWYKTQTWKDNIKKELLEISRSSNPVTDTRWFIKTEILGETP